MCKGLLSWTLLSQSGKNDCLIAYYANALALFGRLTIPVVYTSFTQHHSVSTCLTYRLMYGCRGCKGFMPKSLVMVQP